MNYVLKKVSISKLHLLRQKLIMNEILTFSSSQNIPIDSQHTYSIDCSTPEIPLLIWLGGVLPLC